MAIYFAVFCMIAYNMGMSIEPEKQESPLYCTAEAQALIEQGWTQADVAAYYQPSED